MEEHDITGDITEEFKLEEGESFHLFVDEGVISIGISDKECDSDGYLTPEDCVRYWRA